MRILFGFMGIGLWLAAIMMGGPLRGFLDPPSFVIVIGGSIAFTLAYHTWSDLSQAFIAGLKSEPVAPEQAEKHITVMSTARLVTGASGVVGTMIGLVLMLQNLDDPKHIGPALAVSFLTLLYAVILSEFLLAPLMNRIRLRATETGGEKEPLKPAMISVVTVPLALLALFALIAAFTFQQG